jgi:negative regulator of sigma E activity
MNQTVDEQLSALLDGETTPEELDLLLERLDRDPGLGATLTRYGLIGDTLRGGVIGALPGFHERVRAAIDREEHAPGVTPAVRRIGRRRWSMLGAVATAAAALAAVAIVLPRALQLDPVPRAMAPALVASGAPSVQQAMSPRYLVAHPSPIPADRLTTYLVSHGAYANEFSQPSWDSHVINGQLERVAWQSEAVHDAR